MWFVLASQPIVNVMRPGELPLMRKCQIRVQFEFRVKRKFLAALNKLQVSFFHCHCLPWPYSFQKRYDTCIVNWNSLEDKWVWHQKTFHLLSKLLKVFLNDSCAMFFSRSMHLNASIHTLAVNVDKVKCNIIAKSSFLLKVHLLLIRRNCFSLCKHLHFHSAY